jgi:hypothetical protein
MSPCWSGPSLVLLPLRRSMEKYRSDRPWYDCVQSYLCLTAHHSIPFRPLQVFRDTDVLYEELAANLETPVEFYVYNSDSDEVNFNSIYSIWNEFSDLAACTHNQLFDFPLILALPGPHCSGDAFRSVGRWWPVRWAGYRTCSRLSITAYLQIPSYPLDITLLYSSATLPCNV